MGLLIKSKEIEINKYAQGLVIIDDMLATFESISDAEEQRYYLLELVQLIIQSKPREEDIDLAIAQSLLKKTYTPCILLKKGVKPHQLELLVRLPSNELKKTLILLLSLFKIAYLRRYEQEKNNPNKWWYWDLSDEENIRKMELSRDSDK